MAVKLNAYRIVLRHPKQVTHAQTIDAPSLQEEVRLTRIEAADMMGGDPGAWSVSSSEQLTGPAFRKAA